eukprot:m.1337426 g.1337426  ORF g.1337426 m.1337426 type:complete len:87 (+) comp24882_c1_seq19:1737-1997(+)
MQEVWERCLVYDCAHVTRKSNVLDSTAHTLSLGLVCMGTDPGQHTTEVLQQRLHMVDVDIARLKAAGIVGYTPTPGTPLQRWMSKL